MKQTLWLALAFFLLCSCDDERTRFRIVLGKPYALRQMPDSTYLASMDSLDHAEVLKPQKVKPEVTVSPFLQSQFSQVAKESAQKSKAQKNESEMQHTDATLGQHEEAFAERFQKAMDKLLAEPDNAKLYREVNVKQGEDWLQLLNRIYGAKANQLPMFVVKNQLQSLNGSAPEAGQTIRLPQL
ncbi:MAG TPA: hypothetical protein VLM37_13270 [Fibrobacteraceae bacterium]|nr:hypothetical protein [Fibrobacteraceae bacterium]